MDFWLTLPTAVQCGLLSLLGAVVGGQINRGIYRLAWESRRIGPWSSPLPEAPPRRWYDRVPIVGWWGLRRESACHGSGYWIRPMLIEVAWSVGAAGLYWWETSLRLLPRLPPQVAVDSEQIVAQYLAHLLLIALMTVATFIDFDEQTIPDEITVPGTIAGLVLAAALPYSGLPTLMRHLPDLAVTIEPLRLTTPHHWVTSLNGWTGLVVGWFCFTGWCGALIPKLWTFRRGWRRAVPLLMASMWRSGWCGPFATIALIGNLLIGGVWMLGSPWWPSLLSSLVGMAISGGMIWGVRIVAGMVLGEEAMGFGDVTLMGMIGAFLGWQASLIVFFLAPFAALFVAVGQWLLTRRRDIAFGPYLCVAALVLIVEWRAIWYQQAAPLFSLGWEIPVLLVGCIVALGPLLWGWRAIKYRLFGW